MPLDPAGLPLTGERTVPGVPAENYWFRRHEVAYQYVREIVAGLRVLEVGCGEGYGSALLAGVAQVVGIDYDAMTVGHAARTYSQASFVRANLAALPVRDAAVQALVSLQVIEHVWDHGQFLRECCRVLVPGGRFVISTPNRLTFSPGGTPTNLFHTREFTAAELTGLVAGCGFEVEAALGVHAGGRLRELDRRHRGSFVAAQLAKPPEEWSDALRADVAAIRSADFGISPRDLDASLDLLLLARACH